MPHASFETLSDDELHATVRRLTARCNVALAELLAHLGEVETRGIHRTRACATLYTYCLYELRMSEDAAFRRSKAARLVREHPELRDIVARGELHLTSLLMIAPYLGGERHTEILERARFRSKREVARLIAEVDPKPEVPPRIEPVAPAANRRPTAQAFAEALAGPVRSLPVGDRPADWIEPDYARETDVAGAPDGASQDIVEAERALEGAWQTRRGDQTERPLRYKVQFTASQEYVDLLEEALDLLGCQGKAASLPEVQVRALRELVERLRKRKTGERQAPARVVETTGGDSRGTDAPARVGNTTEQSATPTDARQADASARRPTHSRYVPVTVRRAVWARDASQCAYVDERGRRCAETRGLELHHRKAYALGGPATVQNLELRCKIHNALAAEQDFGREHMGWMRGAESVETRVTATRNAWPPGRETVHQANAGPHGVARIWTG